MSLGERSPKKKKRSTPASPHVLCSFRLENDTKRATKQVMTFFFFFGDHPFLFYVFQPEPVSQQSSLELHFSVPLLLKKNLNNP